MAKLVVSLKNIKIFLYKVSNIFVDRIDRQMQKELKNLNIYILFIMFKIRSKYCTFTKIIKYPVKTVLIINSIF